MNFLVNFFWYYKYQLFFAAAFTTAFVITLSTTANVVFAFCIATVIVMSLIAISGMILAIFLPMIKSSWANFKSYHNNHR